MANTKITSRVIAANAILTANITDANVTTAKIADSNVTVGKMAANSVDSDQYVDGSIDTAHIADSQITVGKMAANSVDSAQYVDGSIDTAHYADNSITGAELADNIDIAGTFDVTGATTLDSTLAVAGVLTANAGVVVDNFTLDGTTLALSSGDLTLDAAGDIILDADGADVRFKDAGTEWARFQNASGDFYIHSKVDDKDIVFVGQDNGSTISALTLDMSAAGAAAFNSTILYTTSFAGDGSASAPSIRFNNAATGLYHAGSDQLGVVVSGGEKMRIQANGYIGIGTTAPSTTFDVEQNHTTAGIGTMRVLDPNGGTLATDMGGQVNFSYDWKDDGTKLSNSPYIKAVKTNATSGDYGGGLAFGTRVNGASTAEAMRINDAGLVCIGDTTERSGNQDSIKSLQVTGAEAVMGIKNTTVTDSSQRGMIIFTINDNSAQGRITCNNDSTLFTTLSDYRLKEVLEPLPNGLDRLNQLNPVKFKWKKQGSTREGFLAHEVAEIVPEAVSGEKDGEDMQSVDYGRITPLLVKAIQEQQTIIEDLKARIETLEG